MSKILMTLEGEKKLHKKLKYLKEIKRPSITNDISKARKFGDLKENAEYHSAKEEQAICEKKIKEIEKKLFYAHIIDISKNKNKKKIVFGSLFTLINLKNNKKITYRIVGDDESNIKKKLISINSPLVKKILGKKKKEIISLKTFKGKIKYKILKIK